MVELEIVKNKFNVEVRYKAVNRNILVDILMGHLNAL